MKRMNLHRVVGGGHGGEGDGAAEMNDEDRQTNKVKGSLWEKRTGTTGRK